MGRISTRPRYATDITGSELLSLGGLEGGNVEKLEKLGIFNLRTGDRILVKFHIYKDIMSQSSCVKSRLDPVTLGGVEGGNRESCKTFRVERSG